MNEQNIDSSDTIPGEPCAVCGDLGDDRRTLRLRFFYELREMSTKLQAENFHLKAENGDEWDECFYHLRACKSCRGDFLGLLKRWCAGEFVKREEHDEQVGIPVRVMGVTRFVAPDRGKLE
jgi:hypothetical protein